MTTEPKPDPEAPGSTSSMDSMSDPDVEHFTQQEQAVVQKRKGGRKPIYATSEERKQRNRQAQAAFRERRTEYIKQLETTIKHHEDSLQTLQQGQRSSTDECMMLRYKVSLYERILHERGVDLQAELHTRNANQGGRDAPPLPAPAAQAPALQRAIMNRHHQARRSPTGGPLKMEPMHLSIPALRSPGHHPHSTSPSQASSSSSTSPAFAAQGVLTPPASDHAIPLRPSPMASGVRTTSAPHAPGITPMVAGPGGPRTPGGPPRHSNFYPSPFQHHIDQLEQEYDAQADIMDDDDPTETAGPGPYPQGYQPTPPQQHHDPLHYPHGQPPQPPKVTQSMSSNQQMSPAREGPVFHGMNEIYSNQDLPPTEEQYGMWQNMNYPPPYSFPPTSALR